MTVQEVINALSDTGSSLGNGVAPDDLWEAREACLLAMEYLQERVRVKELDLHQDFTP